MENSSIVFLLVIILPISSHKVLIELGQLFLQPYGTQVVIGEAVLAGRQTGQLIGGEGKDLIAQ